jgi:hypothetical protein
MVYTLMSIEMVHDIDQWQRQQPDLPNRSEAVRRLLAEALKPTRRRKLANSPIDSSIAELRPHIGKRS